MRGAEFWEGERCRVARELSGVEEVCERVGEESGGCVEENAREGWLRARGARCEGVAVEA